MTYHNVGTIVATGAPSPLGLAQALMQNGPDNCEVCGGEREVDGRVCTRCEDEYCDICEGRINPETDDCGNRCYSMCCGAPINPETNTCGSCRDHC